jgi:hypothetical protein
VQVIVPVLGKRGEKSGLALVVLAKLGLVKAEFFHPFLKALLVHKTVFEEIRQFVGGFVAQGRQLPGNGYDCHSYLSPL